MKLGTVNIVIFLCFISKKTVSVQILIVDIPNNTTAVSEDVYYDYDETIPEIKTPKPKYMKLNLKGIFQKKHYCQRFGSMYGVTWKHKCEIFRFKRDIGNTFSRDKVHYMTQNKKKPTGNKFLQNNLYSFSKTTSDHKNCTVNDIANNKCKSKSEKLIGPLGILIPFVVGQLIDHLGRTTNVQNNPQDCTDCTDDVDDLNQLKSRQYPDTKSVEVSDEDPMSANGFSKDYADDFWKNANANNDPRNCNANDFINNKCKLNSDELNQIEIARVNSISNKNKHRKRTSEKGFSQDYVDDFFRTTNKKHDPRDCTVSDLIKNKCKLNSNDVNKLKKRQFPYIESHEHSVKNPLAANGISEDYVDYIWKTIIANKYPRNEDRVENSMSQKGFSQDYVDDFFRTRY